MASGETIWVDSEVHLLPPEWCARDFAPPARETVMRRAVYDHPERERALSQATAEGLLAEMARSGVDRAVIMGLPWRNAGACWRNNAYVAETVRAHAGRFVGVAVLPSPRDVDPADAVRRVADEYGLAGVKVIPSWQDWRLDDAAFAPALEEMERRGLVLVPHTDHAYVPTERADTAAALFAVAQRHRGLKILAPHLGGLLCLNALHPPVGDVLRNMMFITTVPTTMQMVRFAVEAVGAGRVAFGTDFPFNPSHDQRAVRADLEALGFDEAGLRRIAGANVLEFLGVAA